MNSKTESWKTMRNKNGFEYKNIIDWDTKPYHLLSLTIALTDLVDPNAVI